MDPRYPCPFPGGPRGYGYCSTYFLSSGHHRAADQCAATLLQPAVAAAAPRVASQRHYSGQKRSRQPARYPGRPGRANGPCKADPCPPAVLKSSYWPTTAPMHTGRRGAPAGPAVSAPRAARGRAVPDPPPKPTSAAPAACSWMRPAPAWKQWAAPPASLPAPMPIPAWPPPGWPPFRPKSAAGSRCRGWPYSHRNEGPGLVAALRRIQVRDDAAYRLNSAPASKT